MKKISKILFFTVCLIVYLNIGHAYIKTMYEVAEKQQAVTFTENLVNGPNLFNIAPTGSSFLSKELSRTIDTVLWPIFLLVSLLVIPQKKYSQEEESFFLQKKYLE